MKNWQNGLFKDTPFRYKSSPPELLTPKNPLQISDCHGPSTF